MKSGAAGRVSKGFPPGWNLLLDGPLGKKFEFERFFLYKINPFLLYIYEFSEGTGKTKAKELK